MDLNKQKELIDRYLSGKTTQQEDELIENWLSGLASDEHVWEKTAEGEKAQVVKVLYERVLQTMRAGGSKVQEEVPMPPVKRMAFRYRIAAAASVVLILIAGIWFFQKPAETDVHVAATEQPVDVPAPETNRAMITLSDGSFVYLDSLSDGEVARQGNIQVVKLANGQIAYQSADGTISTEITYNTLINPRGSKVIDMKLSDGSRVWLNAGSSITYPVVFAGKDRKVELTGEGYFEVAHNPPQPFSVEARGMEVKVLGTHFNVNAYDDEAEVRTTLLEGSVSVAAAGKDRVLMPGQQAVLRSSDSNLRILNNIDVEEAVAWKNGYFSFQDAGLKDVMKQISRWYDVNVRYEGTIEPRRFRGGISRSSDIDDVLKILERSRVRFKMEGRTIIVTP